MMKMMKQTFVVAAVLLGALVAQGFAPDSATVMNRIASQESELRTLQQLAWQNPAVKPLQQSWARRGNRAMSRRPFKPNWATVPRCGLLMPTRT